MKIRYCRSQEQLTVIVAPEGTLFLFEKDEKALVQLIIEGMMDMAPDRAGEFAPILNALNEKETLQ